jgi:hypothetical protein
MILTKLSLSLLNGVWRFDSQPLERSRLAGKSLEIINAIKYVQCQMEFQPTKTHQSSFGRVARFVLMQCTRKGENITNNHKT